MSQCPKLLSLFYSLYPKKLLFIITFGFLQYLLYIIRLTCVTYWILQEDYNFDFALCYYIKLAISSNVNLDK